MGEAKRRRDAEVDMDRLITLKVGQANPLLPLWLVALFAIVVLLGFWLSPARAHEFYPYECCSDRDCWPTGYGTDAKEPDPVAVPGGWRLFDGALVPYAAARPSPDGRFHVCRSGGALTGALISPGGRPPCLWAPPNGS